MSAPGPTAFTSSEPLGVDELRAAGPPRYPRPSRLATPLEVTPAKAADGGRAARARRPSATLLEHLPRDRQSARTIAELATDEVATVIVQAAPDHQPAGSQVRDEPPVDRGGGRTVTGR